MAIISAALSILPDRCNKKRNVIFVRLRETGAASREATNHRDRIGMGGAWVNDAQAKLHSTRVFTGPVNQCALKRSRHSKVVVLPKTL